MISHKHKFIFIHIPKCAGTSIESALMKSEDVKSQGGHDHRTVRMIESPLANARHLLSAGNAREVVGAYRYRRQLRKQNPGMDITVTADQWNAYYKFAFVRNPWARAYSAYKNVMRDERHKTRWGICEDLSLNRFLKEFLGRRMLRRQTHWLKDFSGKVELDFIGRFESLNVDFKKVCADLNLDGVELPHKMAGAGGDFREQYDAASVDLVREYYAEEIEMFDYAFEGA